MALILKLVCDKCDKTEEFFHKQIDLLAMTGEIIVDEFPEISDTADPRRNGYKGIARIPLPGEWNTLGEVGDISKTQVICPTCDQIEAGLEKSKERKKKTEGKSA